MKYEADSPNTRLGMEAETIAAKIMQSRGSAVLPACSIIGNTEATKAPMFLPPDGGIIVCPDLLTFRDGKHTWIDVKGKSVPSWRRNSPGPRWEHGIDYSHMLEYKRCGEITGGAVWILLKESKRPSDTSAESPLVVGGDWLAIKLSDAEACGERRTDWPGGKIRPGDRGSKGLGGFLWPRSAMSQWGIGGAE